MTATLAQRMEQDGYDGYAYSYPHKTAYRAFDPPLEVGRAWRDEETSRLFLYLHLPFCEMRCGFCNLFTTVRPSQGLVEGTLAALQRQIAVVAERVRPAGVARMAMGGGTPSYLSERQLEELFAALSRSWPVTWGDTPLSLEVSPGTVSPGKLTLLRELGVTRLSLGLQSFLSEDLAALHRPALGAPAEEVCQWVLQTGFDTFNLDLIYGIEDQDEERWQQNLSRALVFRPDELYLYPLYVGKLTGLDRLGRRPGERRRALYRSARDRLLEEGYEQISMRLFRRRDSQGLPQDEYCCQQDGMVGLGPGARSYTRDLHYSSEYAVGQPGVRAIISAFAEADYGRIHHGCRLDQDEQRRRYLLKSLLRVEGLDVGAYIARFGESPLSHFGAEAGELLALGLMELDRRCWRLTAGGLEWSDTIGPWLYSSAVQSRMREYELR